VPKVGVYSVANSADSQEFFETLTFCSQQISGKTHFRSLVLVVTFTSYYFLVMNLVEQFNSYRSQMNEKIMAADNLIIKRIFNLDTNAYQAGALDVKSKELIGLTCSLVLRCDDCVKYHLGKCKEVGFSTAEVHEAMGVATLVGGTIVVPHLRRAFEYWDELNKN
jgi:AhpD family alkylhydroperoxidase